jgi:Arylsulfatase regulator (Fe-S oxidoreductase)
MLRLVKESSLLFSIPVQAHSALASTFTYLLQVWERYSSSFFDNLPGEWAGQPATLCTMQPTCGQSLLVEKNGDVYSCDHFVSPEYKLGNLTRDAMAELPTRRFSGSLASRRPDYPLPANRHQPLNEPGRPAAHQEYQNARAAM